MTMSTHSLRHAIRRALRAGAGIAAALPLPAQEAGQDPPIDEIIGVRYSSR